jgi:hypothetical protein
MVLLSIIWPDISSQWVNSTAWPVMERAYSSIFVSMELFISGSDFAGRYQAARSIHAQKPYVDPKAICRASSPTVRISGADAS